MSVRLWRLVTVSPVAGRLLGNLLLNVLQEFVI